ncbi:hypothetical protein CLV63_12621 [Murinocardiopsis flavida]|uniref:Uncharacterized protein n=1 Tax=Murinocardiopsis flavida TaxID=645275 RepID=A0A2P8CWP9_9ACTN|nr:hypothetical protein [Murinocardiopsis flavida]PSK89385.1 hypothetical protein CLV63_12621 [Murinocardiopsis flavida]
MPRPERPHRADVEISAVVAARELTFREVPTVATTFPGDDDQEAASGSDRTRLPTPVGAGVVYRDVRVDYRLATRLPGQYRGIAGPGEVPPETADPPEETDGDRAP